MDSDQDSSASDDWVVLDSCTSDDDLVLALSSGCATPTSSDSDADHPATDLAAAGDADEGVYAISDAEDDDACPPPPAPVPKPLSGLFHHMVARGPRVSYAAFDPADAHHGAKRLVPDPTFSAFFPHEAVSALASTRGLVCLLGAASKDYYVANPATFDRARLPRPDCNHFRYGDPAAVITFDLDDDRDADHDFDDRRVVYRHYRVVVAFQVAEGIYTFESFSSRTWDWTIGAGVVEAETVVPLSGVGALGCAFWRTTMGHFICFEPVSGCSDLVPAPMEVTEWPHWELGEMEGRLCATCMDEAVNAVVVICLDLARRTADTGHVAWTLAGHFEGGCLRGRQDVTLLRSQGKAEVVMWDARAEAVVAMDLEGRTTRTISMPSGTGYYADFIPYIATLLAVSADSSNVPRKECGRTTGTNEMGAECRDMAVDAEAY